MSVGQVQHAGGGGGVGTLYSRHVSVDLVQCVEGASWSGTGTACLRFLSLGQVQHVQGLCLLVRYNMFNAFVGQVHVQGLWLLGTTCSGCERERVCVCVCVCQVQSVQGGVSVG